MHASPEARAAQYGRDVSQAWARGPLLHYPRDVQATELATMLRHAFTQGYTEGARDTGDAWRDATRDALQAWRDDSASAADKLAGAIRDAQALTARDVAARQDGAW